jgi:HD-GYP domain-containing protein (c-di-GMP phosphodiesterase class II)
MAVIKLKPDELRIGHEIPWAVEDAAGNLLMRKGYVIRSQRQLDSLLARGLYRAANADNEKEAQESDSSNTKPAHPFEYFADFGLRLERIIFGIESQAGNVGPQVFDLAKLIEELCDFDPDAALGMVHLIKDPRYAISHSLHTAILCELIGRRLEWPATHRRQVLAAALTVNIAMLTLQEELQSQSGPLTEAQREAVQMHPHNGVRLLQGAGISDELWLNIVLQHHERVDGSGYPHALRKDQICQEARLVAVSDCYAAMVSNRSYRGAIPARDVLKQLFLAKGKEYDETLSLLLVKELSIFPPGGFVALENGEQAMVIKRPPVGSLHPVVSSFTDAQGLAVPKPVRRNTALTGFHVKDVSPPPTTILNYASLWGYR